MIDQFHRQQVAGQDDTSKIKNRVLWISPMNKLQDLKKNNFIRYDP